MLNKLKRDECVDAASFEDGSSVLLKDLFHMLLLCECETCDSMESVDSFGFVAPYGSCKDVKKNRKDGSGGSKKKEEWCRVLYDKH